MAPYLPSWAPPSHHGPFLPSMAPSLTSQAPSFMVPPLTGSALTLFPWPFLTPLAFSVSPWPVHYLPGPFIPSVARSFRSSSLFSPWHLPVLAPLLSLVPSFPDLFLSFLPHHFPLWSLSFLLGFLPCFPGPFLPPIPGLSIPFHASTLPFHVPYLPSMALSFPL